MFSKLLDKLKLLFLNKYLKELLDKIPANGKKTYFGFIVLISGVVIEVAGCVSSSGFACLALITFKDAILGIGGFDLITDPVVITGITAIITGLYHKLLKLVYKKEE